MRNEIFRVVALVSTQCAGANVLAALPIRASPRPLAAQARRPGLLECRRTSHGGFPSARGRHSSASIPCLALAHEFGFWIGARFVGRVAALLALEIDHALIVRSPAPRRSIFRLNSSVDAHASISVPSTVKCSSESSPNRRASRTTASKKRHAQSLSTSRSRNRLKRD